MGTEQPLFMAAVDAHRGFQAAYVTTLCVNLEIT